MKIGVIGGGAIGFLTASKLNSVHDITLYVRREEQKSLLVQEGLHEKNVCEHHVQVKLIREIGEEDCYIICVKQFHLTSLLTVFKKIDASVPIIFLQNGMGHIPFIQALKQPVYIGVVEHGVLKVNDNTFIQTGKGKVEIALYNGEQNKYQTITEQLNQRDFPVVNCDDWESMLAKKLVVNAVINPLTAIFNVQNGKILSNPFIQQLAFELCSETAEVLGIDKKKSWDHVQSIAESTSYNQSSMVKDLFHHRQTEIEAITGYILNKSSKKLPYSLFVYQSVKALEYEEGIQ